VLLVYVRVVILGALKRRQEMNIGSWRGGAISRGLSGALSYYTLLSQRVSPARYACAFRTALERDMPARVESQAELRVGGRRRRVKSAARVERERRSPRAVAILFYYSSRQASGGLW